MSYLCHEKPRKAMDIKQLYELYLQHPQIITDTRSLPASTAGGSGKGGIFLALKGATFDGNKFAASALEKGCSYAIIDEKEYYDPSDKRLVLVDDCLTTFKELAREHRRQFNIPVVGITGTNGKTTTKELVSAVLAKKYKVMHTEGNFNNDVGVPKTLLRLTAEDEIAVVEMGASHPGDIKKLVEYVEPTSGLITNVGRAHLQGFGSFEGVMRTKGELYDYLKAHDGLVFINAGNPYLSRMAKERRISRFMTYGESEDAEFSVSGKVAACAPFLKVSWSVKDAPDAALAKVATYTVQTHLIGSYNLDNCLAAIAVGIHYGVSIDDINSALEEYQPTNNRSELVKTADNVLVVDAYNANPTSMAAALDSFESLDMPQPKMVILGDMRELGQVSGEEHRKIVDSLAGKGFADVWLVGEEFMKTRCGFRKFKDVGEVKAAIAKDKPCGKCILVKGSNGERLFELQELL